MSFWIETAKALAGRPGLWATAGTQLFALAPNDWWRSAPFLPLPEPSYFAFRVQTAYGNEEPVPKADDVITYLAWVKDWNHRS